jgi:FkbM family methyltransferase
MPSLRLTASTAVRLAGLLVVVFSLALLLSQESSRTDRPCTGRCAHQLLKTTSAKLALLGAATELSIATVPALRPYQLAVCTACPCDICGMTLKNGVFAPVESLIFEFILASPACDGTRAVVDVGANVGSFTLLAAQYDCVSRVVALEPNVLPSTLARASLRLNGVADKVSLLQVAAGATFGQATVDNSVDARWGHAAINEAPLEHSERLKARGLGDGHSIEGLALRAPPPELGLAAARAAAVSAEEMVVPVVPLSELPELGESNLLLLKVDVEGYEGAVLPGTWPIWDSGRTVENVIVEVKLYNSRAKRDLLRHLARSAGLRFVYSYREMYVGFEHIDSLASLSLEGRFTDVTGIILGGRYDDLLMNEDIWLRREALPESLLTRTTL